MTDLTPKLVTPQKGKGRTPRSSGPTKKDLALFVSPDAPRKQYCSLFHFKTHNVCLGWFENGYLANQARVSFRLETRMTLGDRFTEFVDPVEWSAADYEKVGLTPPDRKLLPQQHPGRPRKPTS